jgi:hypothetical protein
MAVVNARRILRFRQGQYEIAVERDFESEAELHRAIAAHPEVLPSEDLRLGPLVPVASELDLGAGPLDLLCVDARGRVVLVEFKRGPAGSNVRHVIAQMLDYGSALWGTSVDVLEQRVANCAPGFDGSLTDYVGRRVEALGGDDLFAEDAFLDGLQAVLESGDFVFMYVAKGLDRKTRRVMSYLAEGPQMKFFAVEIDLFEFDDHTGAEAVMVPRTAFVPPRVQERGTSRPAQTPVWQLFEEANSEVLRLHELLSALVDELGGVVDDAQRGRHYRPDPGRPGITLLPHYGFVHFWIASFEERGETELYEQFRDVLRDIHPSRKEPSPKEPGVSVTSLLANWERAEQGLFRPYLEGRIRHIREGT